MTIQQIHRDNKQCGKNDTWSASNGYSSGSSSSSSSMWTRFNLLAADVTCSCCFIAIFTASSFCSYNKQQAHSLQARWFAHNDYCTINSSTLLINGTAVCSHVHWCFGSHSFVVLLQSFETPLVWPFTVCFNSLFSSLQHLHPRFGRFLADTVHFINLLIYISISKHSYIQHSSFTDRL